MSTFAENMLLVLGQKPRLTESEFVLYQELLGYMEIMTRVAKFQLVKQLKTLGADEDEIRGHASE